MCLLLNVTICVCDFCIFCVYVTEMTHMAVSLALFAGIMVESL